MRVVGAILIQKTPPEGLGTSRGQLSMTQPQKSEVTRRGHEMSDGFDSDASDDSDVVVENVSYS